MGTMGSVLRFSKPTFFKNQFTTKDYHRILQWCGPIQCFKDSDNVLKLFFTETKKNSFQTLKNRPAPTSYNNRINLR